RQRPMASSASIFAPMRSARLICAQPWRLVDLWTSRRRTIAKQAPQTRCPQFHKPKNSNKTPTKGEIKSVPHLSEQCPPCLRPKHETGEGDRAQRDGGGRRRLRFFLRDRTPSTMLRMVPLPRFAGEDRAPPRTNT